MTSLSIQRIDAELELWQLRTYGFKPAHTVALQYQSGQANPPEYLLGLYNRRSYPVGADLCSPTGRVKASLAVAYWQSNKIQAKEVFNEDPHSTGMDTTLDVGWADLHGFSVESIGCGGGRHILVRINGTGLTFEDVLLQLTFTFPSTT